MRVGEIFIGIYFQTAVKFQDEPDRQGPGVKMSHRIRNVSDFESLSLRRDRDKKSVLLRKVIPTSSEEVLNEPGTRGEGIQP